MPTGLIEDRYVQAVEFKEVRVEGPAQQRAGRPDRRSQLFQPFITRAFTKSIRTASCGRSSDGLGGGFYLVHELGDNPTIYPADTGVLLKGGSAFRYTMHVHSVGQEVRVRVDTAFKLHPKGWKPKYVQAGFVTMGISCGTSWIFPGIRTTCGSRITIACHGREF